MSEKTLSQSFAKFDKQKVIEKANEMLKEIKESRIEEAVEKYNKEVLGWNKKINSHNSSLFLRYIGFTEFNSSKKIDKKFKPYDIASLGKDDAKKYILKNIEEYESLVGEPLGFLMPGDDIKYILSNIYKYQEDRIKMVISLCDNCEGDTIYLSSENSQDIFGVKD